MQNVKVCENAAGLGCAVHWDTFSEAVVDQRQPDRVDNVCVNPLNRQVNGGLDHQLVHKGAAALLL